MNVFGGKMNILLDWWFLIFPLIFLAGAALTVKLWIRLFGAVIIPQDSLGIITKKFGFGKSSNLPDGKIIALNGESGIQADTLGPGLHWGYFFWQYSVRLEKFTTVPQNAIGVVEARDGASLSGGRVLGKKINCDSFQDARAFLTNGGERGPQIDIIPPGTYRINTELFTVEFAKVTEIPDNQVGIVTTKEGQPLAQGDIAGKPIGNHRMYQDAQAFLDNGGHKGLQEQTLLAGRYFINPLFATVESINMTEVEIAHVGVVISFVGDEGEDVSGDEFQHGNLVSKNQKGVCSEPLDPGMYPINTYTHRVVQVPTSNVLLNWADEKSESHKLDEDLCSITVRSSDGFKFNLDVSQIIHIGRNDAPKVIARFGTVQNLVTQVLEPTIGNYFRNAAQGKDAIEFLKERQSRQSDAADQIKSALERYNVVAVDTLIGDITPPEALMKTLTDRKIAEQEKVTYETQRLAEDTRTQLEQARATADTQKDVVKAERKVSIQKFEADAAINTAKGEAESKKVNAEADANVLITVGKAQAEKITAVGLAEAEVILKKTSAVGQGNYAAIEIANFLASNKIPIVPHILAGSSGNGGNGIVDAFIGNILAQSNAGKSGDAQSSFPKTTSNKPAGVNNPIQKTPPQDPNKSTEDETS